MSMPPAPQPQQARESERVSTITKSQQEELKQIEADLQEEKLYSLRNRLDNLLGSLVKSQPQPPVTPSIVADVEATDSSMAESTASSTTSSTDTTHSSTTASSSQYKGLLLPGRVWVTDPYGDQGQYQGDIDDQGMPHSTIGDIIYMDGRKYIGGWHHGHWHGPAKVKHANGDLFEGNYDMDKRQGQGTYKWNDGRVYVGDFHNDKRHGSGEFRWPDKACYVGHFENGHRHGYGNYKFPDGSVYEGEWKNSQMHGQGECQWADKRIYSGEWRYGKAHGLGKETRPDGSIRHDGLWDEDKPLRNLPCSHEETVVPSDNTTTLELDVDVLDAAAEAIMNEAEGEDESS